MKAPLQYIDLFAGCGGLSTGLHLAGWKGLFAVERNASAFSTLKANLIEEKRHFDWPTWLETANWDIQELLLQKTGELSKLRNTIDLIVGGPPCQGFSTAGRRREADNRNSLVFSYLKMVEIVKPRAILFENVKGFTMKFKANEQAGISYSQLVIEQLRLLGYKDARGELIDMSDYGVPQRRQRFIVMATRDGLADKAFETLEGNCATYLSDRGIPQRNGAKAGLSDLQRRHGIAACPDSKGFESGVTSRPNTGLQRYLRTRSSCHIPNSHRFVNHTAGCREGLFTTTHGRSA